METYSCRPISVHYIYWDRSHHILYSPAIRPKVNIVDIASTAVLKRSKLQLTCLVFDSGCQHFCIATIYLNDYSKIKGLLSIIYQSGIVSAENNKHVIFSP